MGVWRGVHLVPAVTSFFLWFMNYKWGEEGENREDRDLGGVQGAWKQVLAREVKTQFLMIRLKTSPLDSPQAHSSCEVSMAMLYE